MQSLDLESFLSESMIMPLANDLMELLDGLGSLDLI